MDLLMDRTSEEAKAVVKHTRVLYLETGQEFEPSCGWECLDLRFHTTNGPLNSRDMTSCAAQDLLVAPELHIPVCERL